MKLKLKLILLGSGVFLLALLSVGVVIILNQQNQDIRRFAQETSQYTLCPPEIAGWIKVDSTDMSLYPVSGATEYCFKSGSDRSQGCDGGIYDSWPLPDGACGMSHWGYYVPLTTTSTPTPTPTLEPGVPTPTITPTSIPDSPTSTPTPTPTLEPGAPTSTITPTSIPDSPTSTPTASPTRAPETACVGDQVILDLNQNGIQESSESGIPDVLVRCYTSAHQLVGEATTDASGKYSICGLEPSEYYLVFALPAGYNTSPQNIGDDGELDSDIDQDTFTTGLISLAAGSNDVSVDALVYEVQEEEPSPTLTPTATLTPTLTPTATPSSTPTATPTATNTPTPTPTTDPACNCSGWSAPTGICGGGGCTSVQKQINRTCNPTVAGLNCPLTSCLNVVECAPTPTATPTASPRPTATATPRPTATPTIRPATTPTPVVGCNALCSSNARCSNSDYICFTVSNENRCRLATNPTSSTCQPPAVVQSNRAIAPQPPATLPQAGPLEWLTWLKGGLAILGIGLGLLLML